MGNKRIYSAEVILGGILLLGAVLRFYKFTSIPFTNDELSALSRLNYTSFTELIRSGIMKDGHPALVQTFLYYYTHLFGSETWVVKLPFALCGIASLIVVYQIGRLLINKNLGLAVAAFMATSQFFVMNSQVARPYAPGLLFVLLLTWKGLQILLNDKRTLLHYILFSLLLWLSVSTHYFSALTAGIIAILLLGFEQKVHRKKLGLSLVTAMLAYLPQLPVLLQHLETGGIGGTNGWLSAPAFGFILHFLAYLFQYSIAAYVLICVAVVVAAIKLMKASVKEFFILSSLLLIFILVYLTGYLYSVYHNPVLQHSSLFFATPFLLFVLHYGISKLRPRYAILSIVLLLMVNVWGLTTGRQHYALFYHQGYKAAVEEACKYPNAHWIFIGNSPGYFQYYTQHLGTRHAFDFRDPGATDLPAFEKILSGIQKDSLVLAFGAPGNIGLLSQSLTLFPYLIKHEGGAAFDVYLLTKEKPASIPEPLLYQSRAWYQTSSAISSTAEFNETIGISFDTLHLPSASILDISSTVFVSRTMPSNPVLVIHITDMDENPVAWYGQEFKQMAEPKDSVALLRLLIRLNDLSAAKPLMIKTFIWNKEKQQIAYTKPCIQIYKGNPYLYGLMDKVPGNKNKSKPKSLIGFR
ncbi:MAG: glycosyltransferase family 39 protein [Bacteroidia bacterium]|jgi:hypothetical protein